MIQPKSLYLIEEKLVLNRVDGLKQASKLSDKHSKKQDDPFYNYTRLIMTPWVSDIVNQYLTIYVHNIHIWLKNLIILSIHEIAYFCTLEIVILRNYLKVV